MTETWQDDEETAVVEDTPFVSMYGLCGWSPSHFNDLNHIRGKT